MRKTTLYFGFIIFCFAIILSLGVYAGATHARQFRTLLDLQALTAGLQLTDISFSTDARYTRHISQADLFSAFQDSPGSIEHFPSGSVIPPPDFSTLETSVTIRSR